MSGKNGTTNTNNPEGASPRNQGVHMNTIVNIAIAFAATVMILYIYTVISLYT